MLKLISYSDRDPLRAKIEHAQTAVDRRLLAEIDSRNRSIEIAVKAFTNANAIHHNLAVDLILRQR